MSSEKPMGARCVDPLADAITVLRNVKIDNPSARPDTEDAHNRVNLALEYLTMAYYGLGISKGAFADRCVEAIRKIVEGSEEVRQQGLVEACAILNEHYAARDAARPKTGYDALSDADKAEWHEMVAEMRDSATKSCTCGFPRKECIRVVLRNGPPYPPRPCEPTR